MGDGWSLGLGQDYGYGRGRDVCECSFRGGVSFWRGQMFREHMCYARRPHLVGGSCSSSSGGGGGGGVVPRGKLFEHDFAISAITRRRRRDSRRMRSDKRSRVTSTADPVQHPHTTDSLLTSRSEVYRVAGRPADIRLCLVATENCNPCYLVLYTLSQGKDQLLLSPVNHTDKMYF